MARIRSIHPGIFTDEQFATLSDAAQTLYFGLLTEADDQGIFEWKPVTLKMRLRPASTQPVDGLLAEMVGAEKISSYEIGGRKYGAIRNFRKYQRPKYPKVVHPITDEWRKYVGLSTEIPGIDLDDEAPFPESGRDDEPPFPQETQDDEPPFPIIDGNALAEGGGRMEEGEEDVITSLTEERGGARKRAPTGRRLPEDWHASEELRAFAASLGVDVESTEANFQDHWKAESGAKARKHDWDAAFRVWCRREVKQKPPPQRNTETFEQRRQRENMAVIEGYDRDRQ